MGCDIHCFREKKVDGVWVSADVWVEEYGELGVPFDQRFTDRNYDLFGVLASVRRETSIQVPARGIPVDACAEYLAEVENWGNDGHSHSFLHLHELKMLLAFIRTGTFQLLLGHSPEVSMAKIGSDTYEQPAGLPAVLEKMAVSTKVSGMMQAQQWEKLQADPKNLDLLYPYCQSTNQPDYVKFEFDVPLDYLVGEPIERIIASLEGIGGEDQRIVFFFDN